MVFRSWCANVGISSLSCITLGLLIVFFFLLAFRLLISSLLMSSPYVAVCLPQTCSAAALVDYNRGNCGSNFCIIFLRPRQYVEYTRKLLGCDFDSCFDGVLAQEERFRLIRTRDI